MAEAIGLDVLDPFIFILLAENTVPAMTYFFHLSFLFSLSPSLLFPYFSFAREQRPRESKPGLRVICILKIVIA
jgi:hypothetical protein